MSDDQIKWHEVYIYDSYISMLYINQEYRFRSVQESINHKWIGKSNIPNENQTHRKCGIAIPIDGSPTKTLFCINELYETKI